MKKLILIAIILLVGFGIFVAIRAEKRETVYNTLSKETIAKAAEILNREKGSDGLKDWEEELWKTDAANADTDGDGTIDGEEIRMERNPLVAGPSDRLDSEIAKARINGTFAQEETETDVVSKRFFGRYLKLRKKNGGNITPADVENLITEALTDIPTDAPLNKYDVTDITVRGSGKEVLHAYGNAIASVIMAQSPELESEFDVLKEALESEDQKTLERLNPNVNLYEAVLKDLLAVPATQETAEIHVRILNAFDGIKEATEGIQKLFTDSIQA